VDLSILAGADGRDEFIALSPAPDATAGAAAHVSVIHVNSHVLPISIFWEDFSH
jgi:hypothetical protein